MVVYITFKIISFIDFCPSAGVLKAVTIITKLLEHQTMDEVHEADDLKRNDNCLLSESCKQHK